MHRWLLRALAALLLLTPILPGRVHAAQPAQQAALSDNAKSANAKSDGVKTEADRPSATGAAGGGNAVSGDQASPTQPKSLTAKAIDTVKEVAKSASNIFSRVPCLPPKGVANRVGSLPHVAGKLAAGEPVVIIAFGSSSTTSFGVTSPEFAYPNRLARQLRRQYPAADITVLVRGKGGEDAPEMMKRLQTDVIDKKPDLVIWQVGTNAVLRNLDPGETAKQVEDGVGRIQAIGADVVLVDPQYSPQVTAHAEGAGKMVTLLGKVAQLRHIGIFPALRGDARVARTAGAPDRHVRHRRRPAHERLGLRLLRATARRRHHQVGRPDQARRQRRRTGQSADVRGRMGSSE